MKKLAAIIASLLLTSCIHKEYLYDGMIGEDYVRFEIIKETKPGRFKDLPGKVREKEYVPFFNLMTIITPEYDTIQLYDIDNNLKPDYVASFCTIDSKHHFRIVPIENFNKPRADFIESEWNRYLSEIKR